MSLVVWKIISGFFKKIFREFSKSTTVSKKNVLELVERIVAKLWWSLKSSKSFSISTAEIWHQHPKATSNPKIFHFNFR